MDIPPYVIGPDGSVITPANLPVPNPLRWTQRRKAEIAIAVRDGLIGFDAACRRYAIAPEELIGWQAALRSMGPRGLMVRNSRAPRP